MQILELIQGSKEWLDARKMYFGASEAAAMLGLSKYETRAELLHRKATGIEKEIDARTQAIFNKGHEVEALARPIAEEIIGDDLSPMTFVDGCLICSTDGITFDKKTGWENKQMNKGLFDSVKMGILPDTHIPQVQQSLMITGADKWLFTVSDGTSEGTAWMWVYPDKNWFDRIRAGWEQFERDLAAYVPPAPEKEIKADAIMALPAVFVQATGMVTQSNLPEFKKAAESFIAAIKTDLQTDEDFANAEEQVKFCKAAETDLEGSKKSILAQTSTIDEVIRTIDHIQAQLRDKRLQLDKLVKSEKEARKTAIYSKAMTEFAAYVESFHAEIKPIRMAISQPDFAGAMKGLKKLSAMQEAVDTALRNGKFEADQMAKDIRAKLTWCKDNAAGHSALFPDLQQLVAKPMDDFQLIITSRIKEAKEREEARIEAERQRIQSEEEAKARVKIEAEQRAIAEEKAKAEQQKAMIEKQQRMLDDAEDARIKADVQAVAIEDQRRAAEMTEKASDSTVKINHTTVIQCIADRFMITYQEAREVLLKAAEDASQS